MSRRSYTLNDCPICGAKGQEKNVYKPFPHGWVGCNNCKTYHPWVNVGKMQAVRDWNARGEEHHEAAQTI